MVKDLTRGNPRTVLIKFSLPLLGSILFQQLYNIADSLVAGKFIGDSALAAVGNAYEITLVYLAFAFGCNVGCSVILAQMFGAKQYRDLKTAVSTTYLASGILCGILMLLGFTLSPKLMQLIQTPTDILGDSQLYLNIYTGGLLFLFYYNISTGIFSALGDSKTPFIFLVASSLTNIAMDIWFVAGLHMGVAGVAWATFICQGVSCVLSVITVLHRIHTLPCQEKPALFSGKILLRITRIAIPSMLQQSFVSIGNIFIQAMVNSFGTTVIAAYSAAIKLNNFAITGLSALGTAMSNFTAQNIGAGKLERIRHGAKSGIGICLVVGLVFTAVFILLRNPLIGLFLKDHSSGALQIGTLFILIVTPFYIVPAVKILLDGVLRGAGAMGYFMTATFTDLVLRVGLAYVLSKSFESTGIWLAWPLGWIAGTALSIFFYCKGVWKRGMS